MANDTPALMIVGSVGLDTVRTPRDSREEVLGGSATYACAAASYYTRTGMVGVVGSDFPRAGRALLRRLGVDLRGLQTAKGRTFRWSGVYSRDMNQRRTLSTELNVFESFSPRIPPAYRRSPFVLLGNIAPSLQSHVLDQLAARPAFVMADTMDLWIRIALPELKRLIARVDLLTVNDSEAARLTGRRNLVLAARDLLAMGPSYVLIKRGEYGSLLAHGGELRIVPAYPVGDVADPTGAGDSFAGGLMGRLAEEGRVSFSAITRAMVHGSVVASFNVEAFSLERLGAITRAEIDARVTGLRRMGRLS